MCGIDALGIAQMLGTSVLISSADPVTAKPIAVTVDGSDSEWRPATAVVFVGRTADQCAGPSAATCCSYINFSASRPVAAAWARAHPEIDGGISLRHERHWADCRERWVVRRSAAARRSRCSGW